LVGPCSTWSLWKCFFIPKCLAFSPTKAVWESGIGTRAHCRVLKTAEEAGVNVISHPGKGRGGHVRDAGEEAGVHREGRSLIVGHSVLSEDIAQIFGLIHRDGAG
jgi:hypothetical protein